MNRQRKIKLCKWDIGNSRVLPKRILPGKLLGFTLVELLITIAIVAILAAIGLPSYRNYVIKANRGEGKSALVDAASRQEQFYLDNKTYTTSITALGLTALTESGNYTITAAASAGSTIATSYTLTATPASPTQTQDTDCANLTLASDGTKAASGSNTTDCW